MRNQLILQSRMLGCVQNTRPSTAASIEFVHRIAVGIMTRLMVAFIAWELLAAFLFVVFVSAGLFVVGFPVWRLLVLG